MIGRSFLFAAYARAEDMVLDDDGLKATVKDTSKLIGKKIDAELYPLVVMNAVTFNALQDLLDKHGIRDEFRAMYAADRNGILPIAFDRMKSKDITIPDKAL